MELVRVENNVPDNYVSQSRDFQMMCRLLTTVENSSKIDIDGIRYLNDPLKVNSRLLYLMQTKVGFFTHKTLSDNEARLICSVFCSLVKRKGTMKAILQAVRLYFQIYRLDTSATVDINNTTHFIRIGIQATIEDRELLEEILKYIVPTGYVIEIYFYKPQDHIFEFIEDGEGFTHYEISRFDNSLLRNSENTTYPGTLINGVDTIEIPKISSFPIVKHFVGGKIFYIDNTASGATYTFYDENEQVISDVQVGDEPYYYSVDGFSNKDKYYVFNNTLSTSLMWTYHTIIQSETRYFQNGDTIGLGKSNTEKVLQAENGAYITPTTIWYYVNQLNNSRHNQCADWYVPSKEEGLLLKTARDRNNNPLVNWFDSNTMWSSSDASAESATPLLFLAIESKNTAHPVFATRSF